MVKKKDVPQHIVEAALQLTAERGWRGLSLGEIALRARLPLAEVIDHFPSKGDILRAFMADLDAHMLRGEVEMDQPVRDRLFDVMMRRFEAMAPHKAAVRAIIRESGDDPYAVLCGARRFLVAMSLMLEAAGLSAAGLSGLARIEGLAAIYLYVLRTWLRDDSPDMAKTMATLDKSLRRAEGLIVHFRLRKPARQDRDAAGAPDAAPQ